MKYWKDDKGSVHLVEGAILFPLTFMALFLLLFFTVVLYLQVDQEGKIRRALTQSTTTISFRYPEESPQTRVLLSSSRWSKTGLFFMRRTIQQKEEADHSPFHFFSVPALVVEQERSAVWTSSATNLWCYEAVNGFCAHQTQKSGGS